MHDFERHQAPKAVNDVRSRASAPKTGAGIWRQIYGNGFWSVCQWHKARRYLPEWLCVPK